MVEYREADGTVSCLLRVPSFSIRLHPDDRHATRSPFPSPSGSTWNSASSAHVYQPPLRRAWLAHMPRAWMPKLQDIKTKDLDLSVFFVSSTRGSTGRTRPADVSTGSVSDFKAQRLHQPLPAGLPRSHPGNVTCSFLHNFSIILSPATFPRTSEATVRAFWATPCTALQTAPPDSATSSLPSAARGVSGT